MNVQETENYEVDNNLRDHYASYTFPKTFSCGEVVPDDYFKTNLKRALKSEMLLESEQLTTRERCSRFALLLFLFWIKPESRPIWNRGINPIRFQRSRHACC